MLQFTNLDRFQARILLAFAKSITRARRAIPDILANLDNELTAMARETIAEL